MALRRYSRTSILRGGKHYGTSQISQILRIAVENGKINTFEHVLKEGDRLDILSGHFFDDSSLWWVIAACSGVGWGLQIPPGTLLNIPSDISEVESLIG